jgi:hypothetical protein
VRRMIVVVGGDVRPQPITEEMLKPVRPLPPPLPPPATRRPSAPTRARRCYRRDGPGTRLAGLPRAGDQARAGGRRLRPPPLPVLGRAARAAGQALPGDLQHRHRPAHARRPPPAAHAGRATAAALLHRVRLPPPRGLLRLLLRGPAGAVDGRRLPAGQAPGRARDGLLRALRQGRTGARGAVGHRPADTRWTRIPDLPLAGVGPLPADRDAPAAARPAAAPQPGRHPSPRRPRRSRRRPSARCRRCPASGCARRPTPPG